MTLKHYVKQGYVNGGARYELSKEAVRFVPVIKARTCTPVPLKIPLERCMGILNTESDSRDTTRNKTFHPLLPNTT